MTKSSIMIDLADERSGKIAEVLSNKTSKRILQSLAEGEKCGSELASGLKLPLNTVSYNLKKLTEAGLIEKSKKFFWSRKGKKMDYYQVVNRRIVIMPKQMVKGVLPAVGVALLGAVGIWTWTKSKIGSGEVWANEAAQTFAQEGVGAADSTVRSFDAAGAVGEIAPKALMDGSQGVAGLCMNQTVLNIAQSAWLWFLVGALTGLLVYLVWNFVRRGR